MQQGAIHPIGDEHVGGQAIEWNILDVGFALGPLERTVACSAGPYEPMFSGRPLSFGGRAFWSRAQSRHTRGIRAVLTDTHVSIPIETRAERYWTCAAPFGPGSKLIPKRDQMARPLNDSGLPEIGSYGPAEQTKARSRGPSAKPTSRTFHSIAWPPSARRLWDEWRPAAS